jgi:hypothetical protein
MPKLLHFPWLRRLLNKGVNTDVLPELMPDGTAREAINVRPGSITGNAGGAEAVKGEVVQYPVPVGEDPTGYVLIGSCTCNNQLVEFWASESFDGTEIYAPIVRVDGVIVAKSKNIPYVWDRPLQIAVADDFFGTSISDNEDANGVVRGRGVVYPADHNSAPLYWDINQLVNFATSTPQNLAYFGDNYQVGFNSVGLFNTPEFPIHTRNVDGIGIPGLLAGQYQYALRYVTPAGDRTNIGPWTPLITVPISQDVRNVGDQSHYPGVLTIGGEFGQQTPYGIEIKFRVDNVFGFQFIEIIRKAYNTADNIGNNTIVSSIPIFPNQNSIETFVDPVNAIAADSQEIITDEELNIKIMAINKPKSVEYSDRRLTYANFETFPKVADNVEFIDRGSGTIFPVTQGVCTRYFDPGWIGNSATPREHLGGYTYWNDGYSDPVNNSYLKSFMRGERYGIGVMFWNQFAEQSFVTPVPLGTDEATNEGYLFPNRRDRRTGRSFQYSDGDQGVDPRSRVQASVDVDGTQFNAVGPTFEAFSQGEVPKNWYSAGASGTNPWQGFGFINRINFPSLEDNDFRPFGPINPLSATSSSLTNNTNRLSQSPTARGYVNSLDTVPLTGKIWAPRHYALGAAIEGIDGIPSNAKVISVMRTEPANRVVAQGIACWHFPSQRLQTTPPPTRLRKSLNKISLMIPDFNNSIVSQDLIDLFESSPNSFKIQFVSPLGFYTENYSALQVDTLSFAGIHWDDGEQVNNQLDISAYQPSSPDGTNYIGYGAWRSSSNIASSAWSSQGGNRTFNIEEVVSVVQNGQSRWTVTIDEDIFSEEDLPTTSYATTTADCRDWTEPWYAVNIVFDDAKIANDSIDRYVETGCHIKTESCIGITPSLITESGGLVQDFPLLNERLGDVYAAPSNIPVGDPAANRYVYVDGGQGLKPWLCVTDNTEANIDQQAILSSLNSIGSYTLIDGTVIYGVYSIVDAENWSSSSQKQFTGTVRFGQWVDNLNSTTNLLLTPTPANNSRIIVKYDSNEPIRFFGGDCTVSESLDALFNGNASQTARVEQVGSTFSIVNATDQPNNNVLIFGSSFPNPYNGYRKADGYIAMRVAPNDYFLFVDTETLPFTNDVIRQWAVYWTAEQRSKLRHYKYEISNQGPYQWPRVGYIMKWGTYYTAYINNGVYPYGSIALSPGVTFNLDTQIEYNRGGLLLDSGVNPNYIQQAPVSGFGVPFVSSGGEFTEKFYFPTGLVASLEFNQLAQDIPSLRTFLELNLKTISEENGEIKTIASALAGGGRNLYAWTDNGVARVLTNKNVLTGADGGTLGTQSISNYWGQEMWISRNIGIPDQMWQAFVKGYAPTGDGYSDNFFWANRNSLYRMVGDSIIDIGREKFLAYMLPILRGYPRGYVPGTNGFYNAKYNEAWMSFNGVVDENNKTSRKLVIFNPRINDWNGLYTYDFDGHTQVGNDVFGHRGLQTFKLDQGWTINATTREASVTVPMVGDIDTFKEFIRWRVVGSKPDSMEILDPDFVLMSRMDAATNGSPLWVKEYDGWEGWASRTLASYDSQRKLPQKRYFYLRLIWNREEDVNATSLSGQLKPIK